MEKIVSKCKRKNKKIKALISFLLAIFIFLSNIPMQVFAVERYTEIQSQSDLKDMHGNNKYILKQNIELTSDWEGIENFSGELDGNGYTVTTNGSSLFYDIDKKGIIKNIFIKGKVKEEYTNLGGLTSTLKGKVLNSFIDIELITSRNNYEYIGGIAGELAYDSCGGTVIDNTVVNVELSFIEDEDQEEQELPEYLGGLVGSLESNSSYIKNSYWSGLDNSMYDQDSYDEFLENVKKVKANKIHSQHLVDELNKHLQKGYLKWSLDSNSELSLLQDDLDSENIEGLKLELQSLVEKIENLKEDLFISEDIDQIKKENQKAKDLLDGEDEEKIKAALENLKDMFDNLGKVKVKKNELNDLVQEYKSRDKSLYKKSSIEKLKEVLEKSEDLLQSDQVIQDEINTAKEELEDIVSKMQERNIKPFDLSSYKGKITSIRTQEDLRNIQDGGVYRLENDIEVNTVVGKLNPINIKFDGNGHTIKLTDNTTFPLFNILEEDSIIQNLGVRGNISYLDSVGGIAAINRGLIINSYSRVNIKSNYAQAGGIVGNLDGGSIINSYAIGKLNGKAIGGLAGESSYGLIENSYWENTQDNALGQGQAKIIDSVSKSLEDMKTNEFIDLLNNYKNAHLKTWGREKVSSLPYHGIDNKPLENKNEFVYPIKFKDVLGNETILKEKGTITVNAILGDKDFYIGDLELIGSDLKPEQIEWSNLDKNSKKIHTGLITGKVFSYGEDSTIVQVFELDSNNIEKKKIAEFTLKSENPEIEDLKVFVVNEGEKANLDNLKNFANKKYVFDGKVYKEIQLRAKLKGSSSYIDVNEYNFVYKQVNENKDFYINRSEFTFNEPGKTTLEIMLNNYKTNIELESRYVAITSIKPIGGTFIVHERNSMSQNFDFIPLTGAGTFIGKGKQVVEVEPANASYKDIWEIKSLDKEIAEYVPYIIVSIVPYKAGEVEFTAISKDPRLSSQLSGKSIIKIEYKNPIKEVKLENKDILIKEEDEQPLNLDFIGSNQEEKHVSQPDIIWTYQGDGKVNISPKSKYIDQGVNKPYVADDKYFIKGIAAGKVTATGVFVDTTNSLEPIVVNITVLPASNLNEIDVEELAEKGLSSGKSYIQDKYQDKGYTFGDEWIALTNSRTGKNIDDYTIQSYIDDVKESFSRSNSEYKSNQKPTTIARTILGLSSLGVDVKQIDSYNFIEKLLNSNDIKDGANEAIFALIAIDSNSYGDEGYKWNREKLVDEIIKHQNSSTGGFSLDMGGDGNVDITAMALQSLSNYKEEEKIKISIDKGLKFLKENLDSSFGYESSESTAQVLLALSTLQIDPLEKENGFSINSRKNIITALMKFYCEDNLGFKHKINDRDSQFLSTLQATYALEGYKRFKTAKKGLYDFSDIKFKQQDENIDIFKNKLVELIDKSKKIIKEKDKYKKEDILELEKILFESGNIEKNNQVTLVELKSKVKELESFINNIKIKESAEDLINLPKGQIHVYFTLKGMPIKGNKEQTWISRQKRTIKENSKVFDLFDQMLGKHHIDYKIRDKSSGGYVYSIKSPVENEWLSEFTNGKYSGWMYTVNGVHVPYGLMEYTLSDKDEVVWHYTNDYRSKNVFDVVEKVIPDIKPKVYVKEKIGSIIFDKKLKKELEDNIKKSQENKKGFVTIDMKTKEELKGIKLSLSKDIISKITKKHNLGFEIVSNLVNIKFDKNAMNILEGKQLNSKSDIVIQSQKISDINKELLSQDENQDVLRLKTIKEKIGDRPVFDFTVLLDNNKIAEYKDGLITMAIPYKLNKLNGENASSLTVYKIGKDGSIVELEDAVYDAKKEEMTFKTNYLSMFGIGEKQNEKDTIIDTSIKCNFIDVKQDAWYAKAVNELNKRQLINGKSKDEFYPNHNISRAEFVTILANWSKESMNEIKDSPFEDVKLDDWYCKQISWAYNKKIVSGYDKKFKPDNEITRQEMVTILFNYINYNKDIKVLKNNNEIRFNDDNKINNWAKESVKIMANSNIIKGRKQGEFMPNEKATRAEAVQIIYNIITCN